MLLEIPRVLSPEQVMDFRARLAAATWIDGRVTAGHQSVRVKHNLQLPESDPVARELGAAVRAALERSPLFLVAALPRRIFPPLFNCYRGGDMFGNHVDNAVRYDRTGCAPGKSGRPIRTDLSATLFLSSPEEYDGGELVIEEPAGARRIKLAAGDLVLYPSTSIHRVEPVRRGMRFASFFWLQSLVRGTERRRVLFDLDVAIQKLDRDVADHPALVELAGVYHNLLRLWADV
ncbi:MAG TPA: Fe2+-dependent dioxygenase [Steroidobacteraceae bacterium]|nr:Fe2+-dependent dioxygenase [Steroidobacteraceae bacterium]